MGKAHRICAACGLLVFIVSGCAGVSVQPLNYNGLSNGEAPGIRYYMPKPYLLVTELPTVQTTQTITTSGPQRQPKAGAAAVPAPGPSPAPVDTKNTTSTEINSTQTASNGSGTDLSYTAVTGNYQLKLIYLPDLSKQMAITMNAGLFGTVSAQPTLQDGWMLTSLQGSAVSDGAGALTAFASVVSALGGTATKAATTGAKLTAQAGDVDPTVQNTTTTNTLSYGSALLPGLYEFYYDDYGILRGLCRLTGFPKGNPVNDPNGCANPVVLFRKA